MLKLLDKAATLASQDSAGSLAPWQGLPHTHLASPTACEFKCTFWGV